MCGGLKAIRFNSKDSFSVLKLSYVLTVLYSFTKQLSIMKKTKVFLPLMAFVFALAGALVSRQSQASPLIVGQYYYTTSGTCADLPVGSCNNSPFGDICQFNPGSGYTEVYDDRFSSNFCATVLRHSLNGGYLN